MTMRSTQPLTEMSARNLPGGKERSQRKADNLTSSVSPLSRKIWEPRRLTTPWASTGCYRDRFYYYLYKLPFSNHYSLKPRYKVCATECYGNAPLGTESESELLYNWRSVSQYVLVSSPIWDFWPEIFFFSESYSLVLIGAPSLTRGRVYHLSVYSLSTVVSKYLQKIFTYCVIHI
jgi:hypothetical protein